MRRLTEQLKHSAWYVPPIASRYLSPASIGKSHPVHFAWNMRRKSEREWRLSFPLEISERDYLRRSMVLLLQHEMFLFQSTSCMQYRGNIRDANFSPGLERTPRICGRIDGAFEKIRCLLSRSFASIWHSRQRVFVRNLSRSTICHFLPRTRSRRDQLSSANRWNDWRRSNDRLPKWMDLYRLWCCTRIEKVISDRLPNFDSTGMTDSDLISSVVLIQQSSSFETLLSGSIATEYGFTSS